MADCLKLILTVFLAVGLSASTSSGQDETYSINHCLSCPPGTYVLEVCETFNGKSTCAPCPEHYFSEKRNIKTYCSRCRTSCPKNSRTVIDCTGTSNRQCQCHDGYHHFPIDKLDDFLKCVQHQDCPKGWGEVDHGNHTHDTKCQQCQKGRQFVNQSDLRHPVCQDCTACDPEDEVVLKECALDSDAKCGKAENGTRTRTSLPPLASTQTTPAAQDSAGIPIWPIIGPILAVLLVLCGIGIGVACFLFKRRKKRGNGGEQGNGYGYDAARGMLRD